MNSRDHTPPRARARRHRTVPGRRHAAGAALVGLVFAVVPSSSAAATTPGPDEAAPVARDAPRSARPQLVVRTPPDAAWPEAVEAIIFELDQAGYAVVAAEGDGTVTVTRGPRGWGIVVVDQTRSIIVEAQGHLGQSASIVGLHAVELIHASWLDVGRRRREPVTPPTAAPVQPAPPPAAPRASRWAFDLGSVASTFGLIGPRMGVAHHWRRAELGFAVEGGFGRLGRRSPERSGDGWVERVETHGTLRAVLGAAFVGRPGRRVRPLLGGASELIAPIVSSDYRSDAPKFHVEDIDFGMFWVPALEAGARFVLGPRLALRTVVRAGPMIALRAIDLPGGGTFPMPRGVVTGNLSLLFGRTGSR